MDDALARETEKLKSSWHRHEREWLRDYLVQGVEDPRVNVQSILTRHFLVRELFGEGACGWELMQEEYRFAVVMNWLRTACRWAGEEEGLRVILHALRSGSDNAEGLEIPREILRLFGRLPTRAAGLDIPNYSEAFLRGTRLQGDRWAWDSASATLFIDLWQRWLAGKHARKLRVLEVACGSANDYRFWEACGLASLLDYTGIDLAEPNIRNAREMFPKIDFRQGNVFELPFGERETEVCIAQDLFEHLSLEGMDQAFRELARVTGRSLCLGFFQMEETPDHILRPMEQYHWNLLSLTRVKARFRALGFSGTALHVGAYLREQTGWGGTHNEQAYMLMLRRD